jgi:hypothetical protein
MKFSSLAIASATLLSGPWSTCAFVPIQSASTFNLQVGGTAAVSSSTQLGIFGLFGGSSTKVATKTTSKAVDDLPILEKEAVQDLFYLWNDALKTLEPEIVAKRYSEQAILLPTVSDTPRTDYEGIVEYFTAFLKVRIAPGGMQSCPENDRPPTLTFVSLNLLALATAQTTRRNCYVASLFRTWLGQGCRYL